jgi:hypothetical protein
MSDPNPNLQEPLLDYFPQEDGYTLKAYLAEVPRLHNAVRFRFRPVDLIERSILLAFKDRNYEKAITEKFCELLSQRITQWSLVERSGDTILPMPITAAKIKRLRPTLWTRLTNIVIWGIDGGDVDPGMSIEQLGDRLDADMEAVLANRPVIDQQIEDLRKN